MQERFSRARKRDGALSDDDAFHREGTADRGVVCGGRWVARKGDALNDPFFVRYLQSVERIEALVELDAQVPG